MTSAARRTLPLVIDAVAIVGFAAAGRRSHGEGVSAMGVLSVAWPFLVGWAIGAMVSGLVRDPDSANRALKAFGVGIPIAFVLRRLAGGGLAPAFVIVALITTGLLLVGRRQLLAALR